MFFKENAANLIVMGLLENPDLDRYLSLLYDPDGDPEAATTPANVAAFLAFLETESQKDGE